MRKTAFQELLVMMTKKNSILKASVLSGYSRSSYYHRHKQRQPTISSKSHSNKNHSSESIEAEASLLEAIEKVTLEYPSYGVRRITVMLHRRSSRIANRRKVYRLMKGAC